MASIFSSNFREIKKISVFPKMSNYSFTMSDLWHWPLSIFQTRLFDRGAPLYDQAQKGQTSRGLLRVASFSYQNNTNHPKVFHTTIAIDITRFRFDIWHIITHHLWSGKTTCSCEFGRWGWICFCLFFCSGISCSQYCVQLLGKWQTIITIFKNKIMEFVLKLKFLFNFILMSLIFRLWILC